MAVNIKFDLVGNPEPPTIILATRNGNKLGQLNVDANSINLKDKLNDASEFSFTFNKYIDDKINHLWDKVVDFKLVYCKEWDLWFEITVELDEATETVKTVYCTQLGQAELSQIMLYNIEINTEADIERDDYKIAILWDAVNPEASILHRILKDKAPHYSIVHVDSTIANIQRSFSFDDISIYDAFQEIAEEIGCLFVFNSNSGEGGSIQRTISVYDLQQNCLNTACEHRGEFTDICPKCGSTNIKYGYGEDTLIFVTSDELASDGIQLTTDTDSVKNCFKLEAGDDLLTATIRNCNPNGTDYIWRFSDDMKEDMPEELVEKIDSYDTLYKHYHDEYVSNLDTNLLNSYNALVDKYSVYNDELQRIETPIKGYSSLMNAYYNTIDLALYLESGLMPSIEMSDTTAKEQAELLTSSLFLSTVAVSNITTVSEATANSAVLAMAKVIVKPTYKVQVKDSELSANKKTWVGNFVITSYSDEEDTAESASVQVSISGDMETFVKQKLEKALDKENTDDLSVSGLFKKEYEPFCEELKKYALNPLISFHDACQSCIDILIEQGVGNDADLYNDLYTPYYDKLMAIEAEMKLREDEIAIISGVYDEDSELTAKGIQADIEEHRNSIQDTLNFEKYVGSELWLTFCAYRREDKYSNDNYISDGLDNAELFKKALDFYEVAENEIYKASELKHSISTSLSNLLAISKFKPLIKSFNVGNWIRVQVDNIVYKLRLLEYEIDFGDFENIKVEFSDVTKVKNGITDVESILSQASSMATSYSSVQRQANQGDNAKGTINKWLKEGLNTALVQIQSNDNEEISIDKNGLLCRTYDDITEEYLPEQLRLTHNIMAYTDDNWKTVSTALGKHGYKYYDSDKVLQQGVDYGLSSKFVSAGYISGSQIIGGDIYSDNYSNTTGSYINLRTGEFSFGGGALKFDIESGELTVSLTEASTVEQITKITNDTISTTNVTAINLKVNAANIDGLLTAEQIEAGDLKVNAANITGQLTAEQIDATELKVNAANIDGLLTAEQIDATELSVYAANIIGGLTIGQLPSSVAEINDIPTNISELENDVGYQTESGVTTIVGGVVTTDYVNALGISVNAAKVNGELEANQIKAGAIIAEKIAIGAVTTDKIETGAITTDLIASNAITANEIAANAITTNKIVSEAITADKIAVGAITADKIAAGTITADQIKLDTCVPWVESSISGYLIQSPLIAGGQFMDLNKANWIRMGQDSTGQIGYFNHYCTGYSSTNPVFVMGYVGGTTDEWMLAPFNNIRLDYVLDNDTMYALGDWNFSNANVTGLSGVTAVFA